MKYVHPDIVVGEPIPEISPRIDWERLAIVRRWNIWWRWCLGISLGVIVVSIFTGPGLIVGMGAMAFIVVLWLVPVVHPNMRAEIRNIREANSLRGLSRSNIWNIPFRDSAKNQVMSWSLIVIAPMVIFSSSGFSGVIVQIGLYAFMGGFAVIAYGFYAREPGQVSCDKCSYPLVGLTLPCMCPECGVSILGADYTTDCPRIRSPWFWRIGLVISLLGGFIVYTRFVNPSAFYAPVPRAVLMKLAPTDQEAFERLINSPMTQEETDQLIERFIARDVFRESAHMSYRQRRWLGQQFALGLLSDGQVYRILEPYLELSISAPDSAVVGDWVTLWINGANQLEWSSDFDPMLYFGGFVIGDDQNPREQSAKPEHLGDIQNIKFDVPGTRRPILLLPEVRWVPGEAGAVEIRAKIVIAFFPSGASAKISWDGDLHSFDVQPDWMTEIDLRHTIAIEPASEGDDGG